MVNVPNFQRLYQAPHPLDPLSFALLINRIFRHFPAEIIQKFYDAYLALMGELQRLAQTRALYAERSCWFSDWFARNLDKHIDHTFGGW